MPTKLPPKRIVACKGCGVKSYRRRVSLCQSCRAAISHGDPGRRSEIPERIREQLLAVRAALHAARIEL